MTQRTAVRTSVRLPTFLVIGAYKSGTTSLHHHLRAHPDVFVPRRKEPNFFAFEGISGPAGTTAANAVTSMKAYRRLFRGVSGETAVGEVSPEYLVSERACERIASVLPDARLVAILRNPVERAYSDFLMYRRDGLEPCDDFEAALDAQEERHARGHVTGSYVHTGFYADQIQRYREHVPRRQLRVYLYDDLVRDPAALLKDLYGFLGVDDDFEPPLDVPSNPSGVARSPVVRGLLRARRRVPPSIRRRMPTALKAGAERVVSANLDRPLLSERARQRLVEVYRDDIARLEGLIDTDLSDWTR